jgi:hypothetical protein
VALRRPTALWWIVFALSVSACGFLGEEIRCPTPDTVVSATNEEALTCGDLKTLRQVVELLASRPLPRTQRAHLFVALRDAHVSRPHDVRNLIRRVTDWMSTTRALSGLAAAEARSHQVWLLRTGEGLIQTDTPSLRTLTLKHIAVWARSDTEQLALTEMDIEGWVSLGSLCREVQGGSPLRLSIASREQLYHVMSREFDSLERGDQLGRVAVGPFWLSVAERWQAASYDQQQAWIRVTPMPPPMTATSRAYMEAVLQLPPKKKSETLHRVLGPFSLR